MIDTDTPYAPLGGLTPYEFMRDYWQRKPLLIRQAFKHFCPALTVNDIRRLVRREEVESRLVWKDQKGWHMKQGPLNRLPSQQRDNWTVLAQNVDAHDDSIAALMHQFRFIPDARLDDVMISIAGKGGGVGPHFDSYDVFLLQGAGKRRWQISRQKSLELQAGLPLKILSRFEPEQTWELEPGDMLYLPPHIAHDGVAMSNNCMTLSIGFRAPTEAALACGLLEAAGDQIMARLGSTSGLYGEPPLPGPVLNKTYKDKGISPTHSPAQIPDKLIKEALAAAAKIQFNEALATRFLGQWLSEPSRAAAFEPNLEGDIDLLNTPPTTGTLVLDRCTRLLYRNSYLFINGEVAPVKASAPLKLLADQRQLNCSALKKMSPGTRGSLQAWLEDGWLQYQP
jgi:50S ribosomal protein L16 3-hydroxylase